MKNHQECWNKLHQLLDSTDLPKMPCELLKTPEKGSKKLPKLISPCVTGKFYSTTNTPNTLPKISNRYNDINSSPEDIDDRETIKKSCKFNMEEDEKYQVYKTIDFHKRDSTNLTQIKEVVFHSEKKKQLQAKETPISKNLPDLSNLFKARRKIFFERTLKNK